MAASRWMLLVLLAAAGAVEATPRIEHWTLANGARVYFVAARDLPMVQLRVLFDAAASHDPPGKQGLAYLTSALLDEGTGELDADAIAAEFERLGAEFSATSERDMAIVNLRSLSDEARLSPAADLFARLIAAPSFPAASLERERSRLLVALQKDEQSAGTTASKHFMQTLYDGHPYGNLPTGTPQTVAAIARDHLVAHHKRFYVGRNAVLAMVGDLSAGQARALSEKILGVLPAGEPAPALPAVAERKAARERLIPFPSSQAHIHIGQPGITRDDPDYFPLYVGNYVLGGSGLISRLAVEVREKRGWAYSVYSYFSPMRRRGPFMIGLQTQGGQKDQALALVRKTVEQFIAKGPSEEELAAAKKHLTGGFPLRIDSNKEITEYVAMIGFYGLPLSYLDDFNRNVERVTVEQVREAFQRRIRPQSMLTVVLGGGR